MIYYVIKAIGGRNKLIYDAKEWGKYFKFKVYINTKTDDDK